MEELLDAVPDDLVDGLRPLSVRSFLFGDLDKLRAVLLSLSQDLDLFWKGGLPGVSGRGLPGEGGRPKVVGGDLEKEPDLLGGLGGELEGVAPKAACAWIVKLVSPGGKLRVADIMNPGNWRDVTERSSVWDSKLVMIRIMLSFVISVCNLTDCTIHWPKAAEHWALIK